MFVVEMQGLRDNQPRVVLVSAEPSQALDGGGSQRRTRRKRRKKKKSGDVARGDNVGEECGVETQGGDERSGLKHSQSSRPTRDARPPSAEDDENVFEVKRYPAYHYDMYGTIYSLTDGVRPTTLEKGMIKSASVDCLDTIGVSAQPVERTASVDEVNSSVPQSSAVTAKQRKPIPPAKPLKPLPRPKPRPRQTKDIATEPATSSGSTDPSFVAELSTLLKQRNQ